MTTPNVPYRFEVELTVPGTPADVWHAIASAEGLAGWMLPTDIDARPGGALAFHMGPGPTSAGRITAFEPLRRFAYEEDWANVGGRADAEVTPMVTEFVVEAHSGGTCVVRVVTSAFGTGAAWENEAWSDMVGGWGAMLDNLRLYLAHFPAQRATPLWADSTFATSPEAAILAVRHAIGADGPGSTVDALGVTGRIERLLDRQVLLRIDAPLPGFLSFYSFGEPDRSGVHLQGYLFSEAAPAYVEQAEGRWQERLDAIAATAGLDTRA